MKNGDPAASGCTADPKSCTNPGSVSGKLRHAPPGSACASRTSTGRPARAIATAAASPFGPDPTTPARLGSHPTAIPIPLPPCCPGAQSLAELAHKQPMLNGAMPLPSPPSETVSVVIPTRNRPQMVVAAVQSALAQTHPPHEVLVVIDGPETPGPNGQQSTTEALRAIRDPRLRVLALPQSVGGGEARNTGVRAATGRWIAFLDDDDLWLPQKLACQLAFARTLPSHSAETENTCRPTGSAAQPADTPSFSGPPSIPGGTLGSEAAHSRQSPSTALDQAAPHQAKAASLPLQSPSSLQSSGSAQSPAEHQPRFHEPVLSCPVLARSPAWQEVWPRHSYRPGQPMSEYLFCRRGLRYGTALLQTSTLLAPRDLLLRIPFTPGLLKHQDWDWLLRVAADPLVSIHPVGDQPLAVFHVEGNRRSVGRAPNWRFSLQWARDRGDLFTPRAFAGFLATECAAQAAQASWPERLALLRLALHAAPANPRALLQLAAFLLIPQSLRRRLRDRLRRSSEPQGAVNLPRFS